MARRPTAALALALAGALLATLATPALADHPAPGFSTTAPPAPTVNSGGTDAEWELVGTLPTGNQHTDLDFFTRDGEIYTSVGTLGGTGVNQAGQTIVQLTDGEQAAPRFVSGFPSATCVVNSANALGLQHDVEATPKGGTILNADNPFADPREAQLLIDATDAPGRCHDGGTLGVAGVPRGGLEIVDITGDRLGEPTEIGLTSHIGQAHTVNIDPKRPHIAYSVTSDGLAVRPMGTADPTDDRRNNEFRTQPGPATPVTGQEEPNPDRFDLDGFEVVDLSSCMDFPEDTTVEDRRAACRPEVFRYRFPTLDMQLGYTGRGGVFGCHELEIYPNDRLTCGAGQALIALDVSGAFDDNGTPSDFTDDKPRGVPLPCAVRESATTDPEFDTGALVTDCVNGVADDGTAVDLSIPNWLEIGAPSLTGVEHIGTAYHQGRGAGAAGSAGDIDFNHESELTSSGRFAIATDERGGGVAPPGATCSPGVDNPDGNGGLHAYAVDRLQTTRPTTAEEAFTAYARTPGTQAKPEGEKAIYRTLVNSGPEGSFCTAHVMQLIPGQNRIFMAWYTQGTQVVDFVEHPDGRFEFIDQGYFIPENTNQWVSSIFRVDENADGTLTYFGVSGDTVAGRGSIDVYKVTLPPAPVPLPPVEDPTTGEPIPGPTPGPTAPPTDIVRRIAGADRVLTAVEVSQATFQTADTVVLARADQYADALAGGPLAAELDAPLLLTSSDQLSEGTLAEISRLQASEVVLLGGEAAISQEVEDQLAEDLRVRRIAGSNRFATAALIADELPEGGRAFVVEGANADPTRGWPDAVSAGPYAAAAGDPILLATNGSLPGETAQALQDRAVAEAVVVGGEAAVGPVVFAELAVRGHGPRRIAGADRFETSRAVYDEAVAAGASPDLLSLATGASFPDALAAGPAVAARGGTLLLVDGGNLADSPPSEEVVRTQGPSFRQVQLLGGINAISRDVEQQVRALVEDVRRTPAAAGAARRTPTGSGPVDGSAGLLLAGLLALPLAALLGRRRRALGGAVATA